MKRLTVGVLDLVARAPTRSLYARINHANLASIMPQSLGVWCEEAGHEVQYQVYTGLEDEDGSLHALGDADIVFVGAFTQAAQLAYALSALFRARGAVTVLGGPHARCYPDDARKYFDYVLGFTDRDLLDRVLEECRPHRPRGRHLTAGGQPSRLPGIRERWKFIEPVLDRTPTPFKIVPMIGSLGCPYTCSFCIDSTVSHQPVGADRIRDDLAFLAREMPGSWVGWHDPNFGVRFDEVLDAIEAADTGGDLAHIAESSLSLLSPARLERLRRAGFDAMLPGVESWYDYGDKARNRSTVGREKLESVSEQVDEILEHIPYVQTNFVLGVDCDEGEGPFRLTREFIDRVPGAFPGYSLLTSFGAAAPVNLEYQREDRVLPFPFHFLNNHHAMNVRPLNYGWREFYDHVIDLTAHSFSARAIARRAWANDGIPATLMNFVRAVSSEGFGRLRYFREVRERLDTDAEMRRFFEGETREIPGFFVDRVREDLGPYWEWLPEGALQHDEKAYLRRESRRLPEAAEA
jgi:hypothetical protein